MRRRIGSIKWEVFSSIIQEIISKPNGFLYCIVLYSIIFYCIVLYCIEVMKGKAINHHLQLLIIMFHSIKNGSLNLKNTHEKMRSAYVTCKHRWQRQQDRQSSLCAITSIGFSFTHLKNNFKSYGVFTYPISFTHLSNSILLMMKTTITIWIKHA